MTCGDGAASRLRLYNQKSPYAGLDALELNSLREVDEETTELKMMYTELALKNMPLKDRIDRKL